MHLSLLVPSPSECHSLHSGTPLWKEGPLLRHTGTSGNWGLQEGSGLLPLTSLESMSCSSCHGSPTMSVTDQVRAVRSFWPCHPAIIKKSLFFPPSNPLSLASKPSAYLTSQPSKGQSNTAKADRALWPPCFSGLGERIVIIDHRACLSASPDDSLAEHRTFNIYDVCQPSAGRDSSPTKN